MLIILSGLLKAIDVSTRILMDLT